jgi:predicted acyl esterase
MITEGHLRLINRKVSDNIPEFPVFKPYHTFLRKDALPMTPGQTALVAFSLLPTSVLIEKGHSLRIAIAGHDKDVFIRVPKDETPVYTIERNTEYLSFLELPVIEQEKSDAP